MKTILAMLFLTASVCAVAQDTTVNRMEYFIDTDPGVGNATALNIPASANVSFPFTVNLSGYSVGYHKLYIRTRDNMGRWSLTARRNIEVVHPQGANNVVIGEYFIDQDPGFGAGSTINISNPNEIVLQNFTSALTGLSLGYHKLYGRFKDAHGNWCLTFRRNIEVIKDENNSVVNAEYFFKTDNGYGDCAPVVFTNPSTDGTFSFIIPAAQIPADADTLFVRVRDDVQQKWSLTRLAVTNTTVPLTLIDFKAVKELNTVQLKWKTTNEVNTNYFNILRSADANHFKTIGIVKANNVNGENYYSYDDNISAIASSNIFYRLQMVDIDARSEYSKTIAVRIDQSKNIVNIYPNPAKGHFNIVTNKKEELKGAMLTVTDMAGKITLKKVLSDKEQQRINISSLAKGIYIVHIIKPAGVENHKLVVE